MAPTNSNWQSRKGWESPHIRSDRKRTLLLIWVVALVWNTISTPLLWTLRIPANVTGHSGDRDRFAHGHHTGVGFVL